MVTLELTVYTFIFILSLTIATITPMEPLLRLALVALGLMALLHTMVIEEQ